MYFFHITYDIRHHHHLTRFEIILKLNLYVKKQKYKSCYEVIGPTIQLK